MKLKKETINFILLGVNVTCGTNTEKHGLRCGCSESFDLRNLLNTPAIALLNQLRVLICAYFQMCFSQHHLCLG